jgi:Domain of unknown function (DUF4864)
MRAALVLLVAMLVGLGAPACAADDIAAAQSVIRSQEQAFSRDDPAAYSYAAPAIQGIFPDAETFMAMVRSSYAPVYRHKSFEFGEARTADGKIAQRVHILDIDGVPWEALYTLEQQADGTLKITGCMLLKAGQAA